jgi:hypothetical protein
MQIPPIGRLAGHLFVGEISKKRLEIFLDQLGHLIHEMHQTKGNPFQLSIYANRYQMILNKMQPLISQLPNLKKNQFYFNFKELKNHMIPFVNALNDKDYANISHAARNIQNTLARLNEDLS